MTRNLNPFRRTIVPTKNLVSSIQFHLMACIEETLEKPLEESCFKIQVARFYFCNKKKTNYYNFGYKSLHVRCLHAKICRVYMQSILYSQINCCAKIFQSFDKILQVLTFDNVLTLIAICCDCHETF